MKTRRLGRTGLQVSELTFGGGWVGGILIDADDDTRRTALKRSLDAGINWIDTAPSYGDTKSEEALGWLLQELPADKRPYVSTKVRLDLDKLDDVAGEVERSVHASLARLRLDRVDLLQLHNPLGAATGPGTLGVDRLLARNGVLDALEAMQAQGLTRFLGCTATGEAEACVAAIESGRFDTAQVYYNMIAPTAATGSPPGWTGPRQDGIFAACRARDVGTLVIRVFAAGVLVTDQRHGREVQIYQEADVAADERRAAAVWQVLGDTYGTRAQTAIRYALSNPGVATVIFGLARLSHLDEALKAADMGPLPADALAALAKLQQANFKG
jgi:L-galactose dehydrogenase/L-glyceraldehyde 3-phosphate reductase